MTGGVRKERSLLVHSLSFVSKEARRRGVRAPRKTQEAEGVSDVWREERRVTVGLLFVCQYDEGSKKRSKTRGSEGSGEDSGGSSSE